MDIQEAIDLAVKENRVISFECEYSNEEIRKAIHDLKGCDVIKGKPEDKTVHVFPRLLSIFG